MPQTQAIRSAVEVASKIFNCMDVGTYGILRIIATLEILQHHFFQMGHRDLLVTQTYLSRRAQLLRSSRAASAAGRLRSNDVTAEVRTSPKNLSGRTLVLVFVTACL